jgi:hypothetical protein
MKMYGGTFDTSTVTGLLNKTMPKMEKEVRDYVFNTSAILKKMEEKDGVEYGVTGDGIHWAGLFAKGGNFAARDLATPIPLTGNDLNKMAFQAPSQYSDGVSIRDLDEAINGGAERFIPYVQQELDVMKRRFRDGLNTDIMSGSGSGTSLYGLTTLIAESPATGTIHGLNRATYSWFRNTATASGCSATEGFGIECLKEMRKMLNDINIGQNEDYQNLALMDQTVHEGLLYYGLGTNGLAQRLVVNQGGKATIPGSAQVSTSPSVLIGNCEAIWDKASPADSIRFFSTNDVKIKFVNGFDFKMRGPDHPSDAFVHTFICG